MHCEHGLGLTCRRAAIRLGGREDAAGLDGWRAGLEANSRRSLTSASASYRVGRTLYHARSSNARWRS
jgi:hypothetical protein